MKCISDLTKEELTKELTGLGEQSFRGKQIFTWIHRKRAVSFEEMTDLSKALRLKLFDRYLICDPGITRIQSSKIDGTKKFLLKLTDGSMIESVFMRYRSWNSACISTQAGCAMGCRFCASTIGGFIRNLSAGEMAGQIYVMEKETGERISNVVLMGSGEPLLNLDEVQRFVSIISDSDGAGISKRNITISTCGIVPQIKSLAAKHLPINLAISLHAPNDEKRRHLMPIAERYSLKELMDAVRYYYDETHRRLTFEYALVKGENDSKKDSDELAGLLRGLNCVVKLIPVNPVRENDLKRPDNKSVEDFRKRLVMGGIEATVRRELGSDIDSACGQLRARTLV